MMLPTAVPLTTRTLPGLSTAVSRRSNVALTEEEDAASRPHLDRRTLQRPSFLLDIYTAKRSQADATQRVLRKRMSLRSRQRQEDIDEDRRGGGGGGGGATERRRWRRDLAPSNGGGGGGGTLPPVIDKAGKRKNQVDAGAMKSLPKLIQLNEWTKSSDKTVDELVYARFLLNENRGETRRKVQNEDNRLETNRDAKQGNRFRFEELHSKNNIRGLPVVRKFDASDSERSGRLGKTGEGDPPDREEEEEVDARKNRFSASSVRWKPSNGLWYRSEVENAQQPSSVDAAAAAGRRRFDRGKGLVGGRSEKSSTADGNKEQRRAMLTLLEGRLRSVNKSPEVTNGCLHPMYPSGTSGAPAARDLDRPRLRHSGEGGEGREDAAAAAADDDDDDADVRRYIRDNDLMPPEKEDWIREWLRTVSPSMRDEVLDLHILEVDETEATRT